MRRITPWAQSLRCTPSTLLTVADLHSVGTVTSVQLVAAWVVPSEFTG